MKSTKLLAGFGLALALLANSARAEVSELRVAIQPGISYLSLMIMQDRKLIENHAEKAGIKDLKVTWSTFAGGNVMNDALLSGSAALRVGRRRPRAPTRSRWCGWGR